MQCVCNYLNANWKHGVTWKERVIWTEGVVWKLDEGHPLWCVAVTSPLVAVRASML